MHTLRHELTDNYIDQDDPDYIEKWLQCMFILKKNRPDLTPAIKSQIWYKLTKVFEV